MRTKPAALTPDAHTAAVALSESKGMRLYQLLSKITIAFDGLTPAAQDAFLRGERTDAALPAGEKSVPLTKLCNMLQHDAVGLDAMIDEVMEDGVIDADERSKVRQFIRGMLERLCQASAYVAEPAGGVS